VHDGDSAVAVAAPIPRPPGARPACVLLITVDRQVAESALPSVTDAARQISVLLSWGVPDGAVADRGVSTRPG